MTEPLLDIPKLAEYLGVSKSRVYQMIPKREIDYVRIGRLIRFTPDNVQGYLNRQKNIERGR